MAFNRRKSRELVMNIIYSDGCQEAMEENEYIYELGEARDIERNSVDLEYIKGVLDALKENKEKVEDLISGNLKNWTLNRLSKINRAILTLGVTEMLYIEDVPGKVALNEAINLSKKYSEKESVGFINGVLDAILKEISKIE